MSETRARAQGVKVVVTDADGVLTDGGVWCDADGRETKRYCVRDGMGVEMLRAAGIETVVVTGEDGGPVDGRALKLRTAVWHSKDKAAQLPALCEWNKVALADVAYIGDDLNDLEAMQSVDRAGGLTGCPADAVPEILRVAGYVCDAAGGHGAFREFAEYILGAVRR